MELPLKLMNIVWNEMIHGMVLFMVLLLLILLIECVYCSPLAILNCQEVSVWQTVTLAALTWKFKYKKKINFDLASVKFTCVTFSIFLSLFSDDNISIDDACAELKDLYQSNSVDVPRVMRLLSITFSDRRKLISNLSNGEVTDIIEKYPHLRDAKYVSIIWIFHKLLYVYNRKKLLTNLCVQEGVIICEWDYFIPICHWFYLSFNFWLTEHLFN